MEGWLEMGALRGVISDLLNRGKEAKLAADYRNPNGWRKDGFTWLLTEETWQKAEANYFKN